ncbi:MAG: CHAD domain-containing protein [Gammaproteobacteria bacterium]
MSQPRIATRQAAPGIGQAVVAVIDDLMRQLQDPEEKKAVHRIRVDIKRLRAWLRLARCSGEDFDWRGRDRRLRDLARSLSRRRDVQVTLDTLTWLEKKACDDTQRQAIDKIRSHIRFEPGRYDIDWPAMKQALSLEMDDLREQVGRLDNPGMIKEGLKRTYRRADKRGGRAFSREGTVDDLHQLRKWVKYLYYQVRFIRDIDTEKFRKSSRRLDELGDKLGRIHDLDILRHRLAKLADTEACVGAAPVLGKLIEQRMKRLNRRCDGFYRKVFNKSPVRFVRCLD